MNTYTLDRAAEQDAPLLDCPSCGLPAAITDRFTLGGVPGPVEHVKIGCVAGHWYTLPVDYVLATELERDAAKRAGETNAQIQACDRKRDTGPAA